MGEHIDMNLGNVAMIVAVSLLGVGATLAGINYASKRNIPVVSRMARGSADFITYTTTKEAA